MRKYINKIVSDEKLMKNREKVEESLCKKTESESNEKIEKKNKKQIVRVKIMRENRGPSSKKILRQNTVKR